MYEPPRFQHADPEQRQEFRRFKADLLSEDNAADVAMWCGGTQTEDGVTLPSGEEVPFGQWVMCREGMYFRVADADFQSFAVPA